MDKSIADNIKRVVLILNDKVRIKNVLQEESIKFHSCDEMFCNRCIMKDNISSSFLNNLKAEYLPFGDIKVDTYELLQTYFIKFYFFCNSKTFELVFHKTRKGNKLQMDYEGKIIDLSDCLKD